LKLALQKFFSRYFFTIVFLAIFTAWMLLKPPSPEQVYLLDGATMGTSYRILVVGFPDSVSDRELAEGIEKRLHRVDRELMSTYAPDSELSRFNRAIAGEWFPVSPELAYVVSEALRISTLTDGYFDVTVGPLVDLWGFGPQREPTRIPPAAEIERTRAAMGYQHLQVSLSPPQLLKTADIRVDLSGIAKGYGADVIADYFDSVGLGNYFIEVGGELRIRGEKPDGPWVPAIERPHAGAQQVYETFNSGGAPIAVAGSGDYRNYFEQDGVRYSHEIDPFTGRPIAHNLAAVYVVTDNATTADALSTAFMVMGLERSLELAERLDLAAYFITRSSADDGFYSLYTPQFNEYLEDLR
jgi:FAD:protein FMN transferase